jgi:hypothetical protein
MADYA